MPNLVQVLNNHTELHFRWRRTHSQIFNFQSLMPLWPWNEAKQEPNWRSIICRTARNGTENADNSLCFVTFVSSCLLRTGFESHKNVCVQWWEKCWLKCCSAFRDSLFSWFCMCVCVCIIYIYIMFVSLLTLLLLYCVLQVHVRSKHFYVILHKTQLWVLPFCAQQPVPTMP